MELVQGGAGAILIGLVLWCPIVEFVAGCRPRLLLFPGVVATPCVVDVGWAIAEIRSNSVIASCMARSSC